MNNLKLTTLLCSKICHDLITPVGAISTGLEFVLGRHVTQDSELSQLLSESANIAAQRLVLFRCVYGSTNPTALSTWDKTFRIMADFTNAHQGQFSHSPCEDFPTHNTIPWAQVLLGVMYLVSGTCQGPFHLTVKYDTYEDRLVMSLKGSTGGLKSQTIQFLENRAPEEEISSQNILEYLTGLHALNNNLALNLSQGPGEFICYLQDARTAKQSMPSLF